MAKLEPKRCNAHITGKISTTQAPNSTHVFVLNANLNNENLGLSVVRLLDLHRAIESSP